MTALGSAVTLREGSLAVETVSVKSMNRYPGMLMLLISGGYQIVGLEGGDPASLKICFSKSLPDGAYSH